MKPTAEQIKNLDKLLDSKADLQKLGAALVHTMKSQMRAGVEIGAIRLPVVESGIASPGGPIADSIDVGVNDVVSVGWSHDIDKVSRDKMNERIKNLPAAEHMKAIEQAVPKGLESGKRVKLSQ